jgi:hypothetical protein
MVVTVDRHSSDKGVLHRLADRHDSIRSVYVRWQNASRRAAFLLLQPDDGHITREPECLESFDQLFRDVIGDDDQSAQNRRRSPVGDREGIRCGITEHMEPVDGDPVEEPAGQLGVERPL